MYKTPLLQLTRKTSQWTTQNAIKSCFVRFNSSSSWNNKLEFDTAETTTTAAKDKDQKPKKIPFMPVINIPETEFAHNAFFSLYRPLLGLSDAEEKPFFSNKPVISQEEQDQHQLDEMLANYLSDLQPFTEPSPPGNEPTIKEHEEAYQYQIPDDNVTEVSIKVIEEPEDMFFHTAEEETLDHFHDKSMPVFHMPESGDILDFLNTVESKMKKEHKQLVAEQLFSEPFVTSKKYDIVKKYRRQTKPRFYALSHRNSQQKLRRYQKKYSCIKICTIK